MRLGARAKTHKHGAHETAIYVLRGEAGTWYGERLEHHIVSRPGTSSLGLRLHPRQRPASTSQFEPDGPAVAVVTRTDPNNQKSVLLLPELDAIHG
jgi:uncharacterized RmlC-like cupin family protein